MALRASELNGNDTVLGPHEDGGVLRRQPSPWLSAAEAADYLRFDMTDPRKAVDALRAMARRNGLQMYRRGSRLLFDRHDLDRWLRARRVA